MESSKNEMVRKIRKGTAFPFIAFLILMFLFPALADACPMCQGGEGWTKNSIYAYKATTALLAILPLAMGFGIYWWVKRKFKQAE